MSANKPLPNRRLLIVDADLSIARDSAKRCESLGWETYTANRASAALELYLQRLPAVILVEMLLPDGNGLDLIREIRTYDWSHSSRIFLHSFVRGSVDVVTSDARRAGANGLFPKPFSPERLDELVPLPTPSADESGLPYDEATRHSAETVLAHAETVFDSRQGDSDARPRNPAEHGLIDMGGAADRDHAGAADETKLAGLLTDDLELPMDDVELGDDTELDAWLESFTRGDEAPEADTSTASSLAEPKRDERPDRWTPTDATIVTHEGQLGRDTLLSIMAAAWRENWFGRIRVESGRSWTEMSTGEGLLWTVTCDDTGPSVVDVGFRHGLLAARDLGKLSTDLREDGERSAKRVLMAAGVSAAGIDRILELTAVERVMSAFESTEGSYRCRSNLPPSGRTFEARIPLGQIVSLAVDRHVPVMRAVDRYTGREQELLRKSKRFEPFVRHVAQDRFSRDAIANLVDGETLLDWLQQNPTNPGALFLLLTKLEEVGAVKVGSAKPPAFTFGASDDAAESDHTAVTIPATPKQTSRRLSEVSDVPSLHGPTPSRSSRGESRPGAGAADRKSDSGVIFDEADEAESAESAEPDEVEDAATASRAAQPASDSIEAGGLEGAGFAASVHQLRLSGEQDVVSDESGSHAAASGWRARVFRSLDRWDFKAARDELQSRLIEAPEDAEAAAFEAWLAFARAVDGDNGGLDPGHALNELEHVLEAAPACSAPYFLLGLAALSLGNNKQAVAHFDRGIEVEPAENYLNVAATLVRAGYYEHPDAGRSPAEIWRLVRRIGR